MRSLSKYDDLGTMVTTRPRNDKNKKGGINDTREWTMRQTAATLSIKTRWQWPKMSEETTEGDKTRRDGGRALRDHEGMQQ